MRPWHAVFALSFFDLGRCGGGPPALELISGRYEAWSASTGLPVGPLDGSEDLPRWLDLVSTGSEATVTFEPGGRVTWNVEMGPYGLVRKDTRVDGELWTRSTFGYDRSGRIVAKRVEGPGAAQTRWTYAYDAQGRIAERVEDGGRRGETWNRDGDGGVWIDTWAGDRQTVGRIDRYDPAGNLLETWWGDHRLRYDRDPSGHLLRIERQSPIGDRPALPLRHLSEDEVAGWLPDERYGPIERHELWLLAGLPTTRSDVGQGTARQVEDSWGCGPLLNQPSAATYDPTELAPSTFAACICGFCVDASIPASAPDVTGEDLHFTQGPWYRLDGAVTVTGDHEIDAPSGPIRVDALRPGDRVYDDAGRVSAIRSVERLPDGERLGRNLRTTRGTFDAGGYRFVSEEPRSCPDP